MQIVVRTLRVLRTLAESPQGATLQELSDELDIPVGSLHRLLAVLADEEYVGRSVSNRRYFLGPAVRELAARTRGSGSILSTPHPALVAAAQESGETTFVTEFIGDRAVCVALVEGRRPLRLFVTVGQEMPLHAAAAARTVIAERDEAELRALLASRDLTAFTAETPTTVRQVMAHLATVRDRGYDICADELDYNVWAVAAPIRRAGGQVFASVTMAGPADRFRDHRARDQALAIVRQAAEEIARDLGYVIADGVDGR